VTEHDQLGRPSVTGDVGRKRGAIRWVTRRRIASLVVLVVAAVVMRVAVIDGRHLQRVSPEIFLGAAPLVGRNFRDGWDWRWSWSTPAAIAVALIIVELTRRQWWQRATTWMLLVTTGVLASAFALALALVDGRDGVRFGAEDKTEYLANLDLISSSGSFVRHFIRDIDRYSVHVRGHPPGFLVLINTFDSIGLHGVWPVVGLSIMGTAVLPVAVLWTTRAVAGERTMRLAAPWLIVTPSALWMMTSADAFFTAVAATGTALIATAANASSRRSIVLGTVGGLLLGNLLFFTYLGAVFLAVPGLVLVRQITKQRNAVIRTALAAALGAAVVVIIYWRAGFWWFDGVARTKIEYWQGSAQFRRRNYFLVANVAAALLALGPATLAGLLRLRRTPLWWLIGAGLLALSVSNISQYTRGEVERIWLLFYPWIALAAVGLWAPTPADSSGVGHSAAVSRRDHIVRWWTATRAPRWVAVQATAAIVLQSVLVSKW
jgi:methylthioxylose transferase